MIEEAHCRRGVRVRVDRKEDNAKCEERNVDDGSDRWAVVVER